jgi:hypothetical protein
LLSVTGESKIMSSVAPYAPPQAKFSEVVDAADLPYRALSRGAITSIVLFVLGLPGLIPTFEPLLALSGFGLAAGFFAVRTVRRYPAEYSGGLLAQVGVLLNAMLLVGGCTLHTYIYLTEVPDGYDRVAFYELQMPEKYADAPTAKALEIDGQNVFLKGYIHPASGGGKLNRFVLVPDLGTCCFGGEPRSTSMIEVTMAPGETVRAGKLKIKLAGKFLVNQYMQTTPEFENPVLYRLQADIVK